MKHVFWLFIIILTFISTTSSAQIFHSENHVISVTSKEFSIVEGDYLAGTYADMLKYKDSIIFIDRQKKAISLIGEDGELIKEISNSGRGPYELQRPENGFLKGDTLFVWDAAAMKLLAVQLSNGGGIAEYPSILSQSISDFVIYEDIMFGFTNGGITGPTIYGVDLHTKEEKYTWGEKTEEQILLSRIKGTGGIGIDNNRVLFVTPDKPILHVVDLDNYEQKAVPIELKDFKVPAIKNAHRIINSDRKRLKEIFSESSYISGVYILDDFYIVEAHTGTMESSWFGFSDPYKNRGLQLAVFNKDLEQLDVINVDATEFYSSLLRSTYQNNLYFLHQGKPGETPNYKISMINLSMAN